MSIILLFFSVSFVHASFDREALIKVYGLPTQVTVEDVRCLKDDNHKELPSESWGWPSFSRFSFLNNTFNKITINTGSKSKKRKKENSDSESDNENSKKLQKENQAFYLVTGAVVAWVSALAFFGYDWWRQSQQRVLFWDGIDENNFFKVSTNFSLTGSLSKLDGTFSEYPWTSSDGQVHYTIQNKSYQTRNNALLGGCYQDGHMYCYGKTVGYCSYFFDDYGIYTQSSDDHIMRSDNTSFAITKLVASDKWLYLISKAGYFYKKKKSKDGGTFLIERLSINSGNWLESSIVDIYFLNNRIYMLTSDGYILIGNKDCSEFYGKQHQIFASDPFEYRFCKDGENIKLYHSKTFKIIDSSKLEEYQKIDVRFSTPSSLDYAFERAITWFQYIWYRKLRFAGIMCFGLSLYCCMRYWKLKRAL